MPHWRTMLEKDYLGAYSLIDPKTGQPREYTLEIESVKSDLVKSQDKPKGQRKVVIRFKGAKKGMISNSTNCQTIESMYGSDTDGWVRKKITLYVGEARNPKGGPPVPALRVRPRVPGGTAEPLPDVPVDEAMRAQQNAAFDREPGSDDA